KGILQREPRRDNVILSTSGGEEEHVKLMSFGVSNGQPTSENLSYKSPEVLEGRISTIASDIYSLSVVAFEMLTSQVPFTGSTIKEVLNAQRGGLLPQPTKLRPGLPSGIDAVFRKALAL